MGYCLPGRFGPFTTETKIDSFVLHIDDRADEVYRRWGQQAHPEFAWADLDDLIKCLQELRMFGRDRGKTIRREVPYVPEEDEVDPDIAAESYPWPTPVSR